MNSKKKRIFFNQNLDVLLDDCHLEPCLNGLIRLESLDWAIEKIEKGDYFEGQRKNVSDILRTHSLVFEDPLLLYVTPLFEQLNELQESLEKQEGIRFDGFFQDFNYN